ncbi:MAG TPA: hypothetical protein VNL14_05175 [Candidatus Acidoferrales bacterium]|nr:hypothetical protein [Candidatus Acidoferrales bacterium]
MRTGKIIGFRLRAEASLAALIAVLLSAGTAGAQRTERLTFVGGPPAGVFGIFATGIGTFLSKNVANLVTSGADEREGFRKVG